MEHAYWKQMIEIEENGIFLVFGITLAIATLLFRKE